MNQTQRLFALIFLLIACTSVEAQTVRYGASLHESQWGSSASRMQCTLLHEIPAYGKALFTKDAGEELTFSLRPKTQLPQVETIQLVSVVPTWKHGQRNKFLQDIPATKGRKKIDLNSNDSLQLFNELTQGMIPTFNYLAPDDGSTKVLTSLSPVRLKPALAEFTTCIANLLPYSYQQIRRSQLLFDFGSSVLLPEAKERASDLADFIQENSYVRKIKIDGHTDNMGRRGYNRNLGQRRAEAFKDRLMEKGVAEKMIVLKSYGERRPKASNKTPAGRAINRRIIVTLER